MGLFNQGWGLRCDQCEEQAEDCIGGYTKSQIRRIALQRGMFSVLGKYWFCGNNECFPEWLAQQTDEKFIARCKESIWPG